VTTGCYLIIVFRACAKLRPSAEAEYHLTEGVGLLMMLGYEVATVQLGEHVNTLEVVEQANELVGRK